MKTLAGLVGAVSSILLPLIPTGAVAGETVLYSFCQLDNCADGAIPSASLTRVGSRLYGTTSAGGAYGGGTAFALDLKSGKETVLHSFGNGGDGAGPVAGLLAMDGLLYGTTSRGGTGHPQRGTVFALNPKDGSEVVLHSFCTKLDCTDGARPLAGLVAANGILYGTTSAGGPAAISDLTGRPVASGTVFALNPATGVETVLHLFPNRPHGTDGAVPVAGLIGVKGTLYGTTENGGGNDCGGVGCGTVFSFDPASGTETVLHAFSDDRNGFFPLAGLIDVEGTLYGTTVFGGDYEGTVYALDPRTDTETVVYAFCTQHGCTGDGHQPQAGLVAASGTLYGTTFFGGAPAAGTVFSVDLASGGETVVYTFCSLPRCADGQGPTAGLINIKGILYGTTAFGGTGQRASVCDNGSYNGNCGTVFAITP